MTTGIILVIVALVLFGLLAIGAPVAVTLLGSGLVGILLLGSSDVATSTLGTLPFDATSEYSLVVIPMYVLLGMFILRGQVAERLYALAAKALRWLPGGLGVATVAACAGFAAVSGSSLATTATLGKLSTQEMRKYGYPPALAGGVIAAAGTLGILIPPSILIVMYAIVAQASIGKMLIAGIIPGILLAIAFAIYVVVRVRLDTAFDTKGRGLGTYLETQSGGLSTTGDGGRASQAVGSDHRNGGPVATMTADEPVPAAAVGGLNYSKAAMARSVLWIVLIVAAILLGMFTGAFTVIESSALGALIAIIILFVELGGTGVKNVALKAWDASKDAVSVVGMTFGIVVGATVFTRFLVMARVPNDLTRWVTGLEIPPEAVVALFLIILIPLGMFLESMSIILVVAPLAVTVITELGFDPIWFGILFVIMLEMGLITPPVGMNTFVASTTSGIPLETVFRGIVPFFLLTMVVVAVLFVFPDLVTWLPSLLR